MLTNLHQTLQQRFRLDSFRPGQLEAIHAILSGQHTLAVMPTGSGKSLIYQVASLHLSGITLVISPLIALMQDQVANLDRLDIPATYINSSLPPNEQARRLQQIRAGQYKLIYVAPERLRHSAFTRTLGQIHVSLLAVDEAHCISEWGHDFRPDYRHIAAIRPLLGQPITIALTATATPQVQNDIVQSLDLPGATRIVTGFNRPNLTFTVHHTTGQEARFRALHDALRRATPPGVSPGGIIVYTGTRRETEEVASFIRDVCGLAASFYHAGLESKIRQARQDAFMNGQPTVMVATNAFGMGIDRPNVRLVLHFAMPGTLEAYYQEAGRAGRDGQPAEACLLYAPQDRALQQFFITTSIPNEADLQTVYQAIPPTNPGSNQPFVRLTIDNLSFVTGLHPVKVKVALEQLEKASVVTRLGDEGTTLLLQREQWQATAVQTLLHHLQTYRRHREAQLQHMVQYAESKQCRRQVILDHFGDTEAATAVHCCDNCTPALAVNSPIPPWPEPDKTPRTPAPQTNVETAVLDCVRAFPGELPRSSIAKILVGSHSDRIARYQESRFYGRFPHLARQTVTQTVDGLIKRGQLILVGNKVTLPQSVAVNLPPAALPTPTMKADDLIRQIVAWGDEGEPTAVPTLIAALQHNNGNVRRLAASALGKLRQPEAVQPLLDLLTREQKPQVRQYIVKALGRIGDPSAAPRLRQIAQDEQEMYYTRDSAQTALKRVRPRTHSSPAPPATPRQPEELNAKIRTFLSSAHVQTLTGPWAMGWALDFHSRFVGAEWQRSPVGELLFRLKYQEERAVLPQLSQYVAALVADNSELNQIDLVTPVPPSQKRPFDAVQLLVELVANLLHKPVQSVIIRVKSSAPQKEMRTLAQKQQNVVGAFACAPAVQGQTILIVDDLFDSGATLAEITRLLKQHGAGRIYVLTITRTIHTD